MNKELKSIIETSTFEIQSGKFVYAKVSKLSKSDKHFMISQDKDEITVVTREENLKEFVLDDEFECLMDDSKEIKDFDEITFFENFEDDLNKYKSGLFQSGRNVRKWVYEVS